MGAEIDAVTASMEMPTAATRGGTTGVPPLYLRANAAIHEASPSICDEPSIPAYTRMTRQLRAPLIIHFWGCSVRSPERSNQNVSPDT